MNLRDALGKRTIERISFDISPYLPKLPIKHKTNLIILFSSAFIRTGNQSSYI